MLAARVEGQYVRDVPYFNQRLNKISPAKSCQNSKASSELSNTMYYPVYHYMKLKSESNKENIALIP